jgi:peptide/nickel transport system substrate-binding protein
LAPLEYQEASQADGVKVSTITGNYIARILMNNSREPFNRREVRQAISYATPYEQILQQAYLGEASQMDAIVPKRFPGYTPDAFPYTTDLDRARQLLADAGLPDGFSTTLSVNTGIPEQDTIALLMQQNLGEIGVQVEIDKLPSAAIADKIANKELDFVFHQEEPTTPDIGYAAFLYWHSDSFINYSSYKNPDVNRVIDDALSTLDDDERAAKYQELNRMILEDAPDIFLAYPPFRIAHRENVTGFVWMETNTYAWEKLEKS